MLSHLKIGKYTYAFANVKMGKNPGAPRVSVRKLVGGRVSCSSGLLKIKEI